MILPNLSPSLDTDAQDKLVNLSDRLYCAWQCVSMGDPLFIDHEKKVGRVLYAIWQDLEDLLDGQQVRNEEIREEMKKFTEGFAYRPPHGQVRD